MGSAPEQAGTFAGAAVAQLTGGGVISGRFFSLVLVGVGGLFAGRLGRFIGLGRLGVTGVIGVRGLGRVVAGLVFGRFFGLYCALVGGFSGDSSGLGVGLDVLAAAAALPVLDLQRRRRRGRQFGHEGQVERQGGEQSQAGRTAVDAEQPGAGLIQRQPDFADRGADDQDAGHDVQNDRPGAQGQRQLRGAVLGQRGALTGEQHGQRRKRDDEAADDAHRGAEGVRPVAGQLIPAGQREEEVQQGCEHQERRVPNDRYRPPHAAPRGVLASMWIRGATG